MAPRKRTVPADVQAMIEAMALQDWAPIQIERALTERPEFQGRVPPLRTLQRIVADTRHEDRSGAWRFATASENEVKVVLETLHSVIEITDWRVQSLTKAEASYIVRLAAASPYLSAFERWLLARVYLAREAQREPTDDLDLLLTLAPWETEDLELEWLRYLEAVRDGKIPGVPSSLILVMLSGLGDPPRRYDVMKLMNDDHWGARVRSLTPDVLDRLIEIVNSEDPNGSQEAGERRRDDQPAEE